MKRLLKWFRTKTTALQGFSPCPACGRPESLTIAGVYCIACVKLATNPDDNAGFWDRREAHSSAEPWNATRFLAPTASRSNYTGFQSSDKASYHIDEDEDFYPYDE